MLDYLSFPVNDNLKAFQSGQLSLNLSSAVTPAPCSLVPPAESYKGMHQALAVPSPRGQQPVYTTPPGLDPALMTPEVMGMWAHDWEGSIP